MLSLNGISWPLRGLRCISALPLFRLNGHCNVAKGKSNICLPEPHSGLIMRGQTFEAEYPTDVELVGAHHIIDFQHKTVGNFSIITLPPNKASAFNRQDHLKVNAIPLFLMLLIVIRHDMSQITHLSTISLHHNFSFSARQIFEYSRTIPRFVIEYIRIFGLDRAKMHFADVM